jgi:hypothetical protein
MSSAIAKSLKLVLLLLALLVASPARPQATSDQLTAAVAAAEKSAKDAAQFAAAAASAASVPEANSWKEPSGFLTYGVILVVLFGSLGAVFAVRGALSKSSWSLADALSEDVQVTLFKETIGAEGKNTGREPVRDEDKKLVTVTDMRASSSRVIALMGMLVLVFLFMGFGIITLYSFAVSGRVPDSIDKAISFLVAGLTLFAPYLVNKFSSLFQGLSNGK